MLCFQHRCDVFWPWYQLLDRQQHSKPTADISAVSAIEQRRQTAMSCSSLVGCWWMHEPTSWLYPVIQCKRLYHTVQLLQLIISRTTDVGDMTRHRQLTVKNYSHSKLHTVGCGHTVRVCKPGRLFQTGFGFGFANDRQTGDVTDPTAVNPITSPDSRPAYSLLPNCFSCTGTCSAACTTPTIRN